MKHYDGGFSTPLAMAAIFSLCILALPFCLATAANEKRTDSYRKLIEERKKIDSVIEQNRNLYGECDIMYSYEIEGDTHEKDSYSR